MRFATALVLVLAYSVGVAGRAGEDAVEKDRKVYQGTWKVVSFVLDGKEVAEGNVNKLMFINKADGAWIVEFDGKEISSGKSDIDPSQKPKTIDFMPTSGVFSGNEYVGIYELDKDTRKICFAEKSKGRPTEFEAPAGSGRFLLKFERAVAAAGDDLRPLFNGKDLKGWQTEGNWTVEKDGVVALTPRPGEKGWDRYGSYLWTDREYGDFVLDLEYKHVKNGNSGVFFRTKDTKKDSGKSGIEVQILDSFGKKEALTHHDCGGIIATCPPSKNMAKPAGEWNRMIVSCKGNQLKVSLNGEQIVDIDLSKGAMKDRPPAGYIGIQDHGEPFWVRNVKLKELK